MRQAIEENFILDVLKHYTTYDVYFRLLKACEDDPNVERKKAARALGRFARVIKGKQLTSRPQQLAQEVFSSPMSYRLGRVSS